MRKFISAVTSLAVAASMASVLVPATSIAAGSTKVVSIEAFANPNIDSKYTQMGSNVTVSAEDIAAGDVTIPCGVFVDEATKSDTIGAAWTVNGGADASQIKFNLYNPNDSYYSSPKDFTLADGTTGSTDQYITFAGTYESMDEVFVPHGLYVNACQMGQKNGDKVIATNYFASVNWMDMASEYVLTGEKSNSYPIVVFDVVLPKGIAAGEYTIDFLDFSTSADPTQNNPATMLTEKGGTRFTKENGKLTEKSMTIKVEGAQNPDDKTTTTTTTTTTKKDDTTTTTTKKIDTGDAKIVYDFGGTYEAKPGDEVTVAVKIVANGNKFHSAQYALAPEAPISVSKAGKTSKALGKTGTVQFQNGQVMVIGVDSDQNPVVPIDNETFMNIQYKVADDAKDGEYPITFTVDEFSKTFYSAGVPGDPTNTGEYEDDEVLIIPGIIKVGDGASTTTTTTTTTSKTTTTTTTTKKDDSTTTTTKTPTPDKEYTPAWGDTNCDGKVNISDVVILNKWLHDSTSIAISDQGKVNADCYNPQDPKGGKVKVSGVELTAADSNAIIESIVHLVTLPVESK